MSNTVGIRREDKNKWEARVPITPEDARTLLEKHGLEIVIQPSPIRVFEDETYASAGVRVQEDLGECPVVLAVKEIPAALLQEGRCYVYFSHTIKGQPYNMDMLRRLMELKCHLIDYETVTDEMGRRLIFFGRHAGLAGMIDTLWTLGRRLEWEGFAPNPFAAVKPAHEYRDLEHVREELAVAGEALSRDGLSDELCPLLFGFAGYGNVSLGAQEILDLFPVIEVEPDVVPPLFEKGPFSRNHVYKTVFKEKDMAAPRDPAATFDLQDYYDHPEKYAPNFERFLPYIGVLVNCIYWTEKYPRLLTKADTARLYEGWSRGSAEPRLRVIGDISCDVEGSVEILLKTTESDNPFFVYDIGTGKAVDGVAGNGPAILAVDNLPCELPLESSRHFSKSLTPFVPMIAAADFNASYENLALPDPIKRALILHNGKLTPDYGYMEDFIS